MIYQGLKYWLSQLDTYTSCIKTHDSESRGQYSRTHAPINNDETTTREYFTGGNVVQI